VWFVRTSGCSEKDSCLTTVYILKDVVYFSDIIKKAGANNDLGTWTELSKTSLLWKFKSMTKYRDCLGF